ncbi:zinc-ribbon domain-containing protein [Sporosarcina sp. E16_8]|uniref:TcaA NTF2-like domain-containing protein n=1 Tax=Sporosarcina sp. E16_8 TaxID=2789295 RepID=UPI001A9110A2|nr:zinc-ribbon domain-containing protein [Sporosarcina sp. E16_8]MBO0589677.1 zinc-ribbon domain-containing protein [Sporosarcina sp. E16_8]
MEKKFCNECGKQLADGLVFCSSCGTPVSTTVDVAESMQKPPASKKSMPLKTKVLLSALVILFMTAIGTHFTITYLTDGTKQLRNIYNAIVDENGEALFAELAVAGDTLYVKDSFTKRLNNGYLPVFFDELQEASERVKETGLTEILVDKKGIELFRVKYEKWLYFYSRVIIEPVSQPLVIETDLKNTILTIADKEFQLDGESIKINKVLPDNYTFTVNGKNTYMESTGTYNIDREEFEEAVVVSLPGSAYSITFNSELTDGIVYVNGTSTEKTMKEIDSITPVFGDGATFHAVRAIEGGKTEKSEKVIGKPGDSVTLVYPSLLKAQKSAESLAKAQKVQEEKAVGDRELIAQASAAYIDFRDAYEEALNDKSFYYVENYLVETAGVYKELKDFIAEADSTYYWYDFKINQVTEGTVEGDIIKLQVREVFVFENHLGVTTEYDRKKRYDLVETSPGQFKITAIHIKDTNRN